MDWEVLGQQVIIGLSNGMIVALIALGYSMVYGIIQLINFAHGDLFMLGGFAGLTVVGTMGIDPEAGTGRILGALLLALVVTTVFCATLNFSIERLVYRPIRSAPKLSALVSAIGVSFCLTNVGLFWGGLPMEVFGGGTAAASPKNFPQLLPYKNLLEGVLGEDSFVQFTLADLMVFVVTIPLVVGLTLFIRLTRTGKAMRAVAQDPVAARLMGIDVDRVIGTTFAIGGALAGAASLVYSLYNNTVHFQMGWRLGMDAFTAAVLGGIGSLPGAMLGGILIGLARAMSDQYIETRWTNTVVFGILILILVFRPSGLLGSRAREKV